MFSLGPLTSMKRCSTPASGASARTATAPVRVLTTVAASVAAPSFPMANQAMRAPPRISALPWIRSAQAQAFSPPAVT